MPKVFIEDAVLEEKLGQLRDWADAAQRFPNSCNLGILQIAMNEVVLRLLELEAGN